MHTPLSPEELGAWIRLTLEPDLGPAQARSLLATLGMPQNIYALPSTALAKVLPQPLAHQIAQPAQPHIQEAIARVQAWLAEPGHHLLTLADPAYPQALLDIHDPPLVLYVNGRTELLNRSTLAIVGARSATPAGMDNATAFARHLASRGWCIASGLATGIDAAAHQGALAAGPEGGGTVAVLGTGVDIIYPAANLDLARQIAAEGALISEFPLGTPSIAFQFPKRNRIVAGLARGVLVVEAAQRSGSLITARLATEIGREVFAIPGSIHSPLSRGCHALIRQGAKLVESGEDISEELGHLPGTRATAVPPEKPVRRQARSGVRHAKLMAALGHDPVHIDTLRARTGLDWAALNSQLLELELESVVTRLPDGRFQQR